MEKREKAIRIGNRLRDCRGDRTMASVAEEMGISLSALANYESGIRIPNDEAKVLISKFYGVTVWDLFYAE